MRDVWAIGPTAAACRLRLRGFAPREAERLVALTIRYDHGELREITPEDRRSFARYLVRHGWFTEDAPPRREDADRPLADLLREIEDLIARRRRQGGPPSGSAP